MDIECFDRPLIFFSFLSKLPYFFYARDRCNPNRFFCLTSFWAFRSPLPERLESRCLTFMIVNLPSSGDDQRHRGREPHRQQRHLLCQTDGVVAELLAAVTDESSLTLNVQSLARTVKSTDGPTFATQR